MKHFRLFALIVLASLPSIATASDHVVPSLRATALDGHSVSLPEVAAGATILIVGFSKDSADATTAWEKALRSMPLDPAVSFYDMPMLASAPGFVRPIILRSIRKQVPDLAKAHFVPIIENEAAWKSVAEYTAGAPDAAYVMLIDHTGGVRWQTHQSFSQQNLQLLVLRAAQLATDKRASR